MHEVMDVDGRGRKVLSESHDLLITLCDLVAVTDLVASIGFR